MDNAQTLIEKPQQFSWTRILIATIKWFWWLGVLGIPIALEHLSTGLYQELGCPPGDCYVPGTDTAFNLSLLADFLRYVLWPPCIWFLGLKQAIGFIEHKDTKS